MQTEKDKDTPKPSAVTPHPHPGLPALPSRERTVVMNSLAPATCLWAVVTGAWSLT